MKEKRKVAKAAHKKKKKEEAAAAKVVNPYAVKKETQE
jgi:hypothetical protein